MQVKVLMTRTGNLQVFELDNTKYPISADAALKHGRIVARKFAPPYWPNWLMVHSGEPATLATPEQSAAFDALTEYPDVVEEAP